MTFFFSLAGKGGKPGREGRRDSVQGRRDSVHKLSGAWSADNKIILILGLLEFVVFFLNDKPQSLLECHRALSHVVQVLVEMWQ